MNIGVLLIGMGFALLPAAMQEAVAQEALTQYSAPQNTGVHERLSSLDFNPALRAMRFGAASREWAATQQLRNSEPMLELPFFEDFSAPSTALAGPEGYPSAERWANRQVWVNNSWSVSPPTVGVATFDVLNEAGQLHPSAPTASWGADTLTSHPINLEYPGQTDIWFSFWYQPEGLGNAPEKNDSLLVDFFNPITLRWENVWQAPGDTLHPFRQVMIPVNRPDYLQKGFRFRFRNRVSLISDYYNRGLRGNGDHWHVDYIRLDKLRSAADSTFRDVGVVSGPGTLLSHYEEVPYTHFQVAFLSESNSELSFSYRNLWHTTLLTGRRFSITDMWDPQQRSTFYWGGNANTLPAIETRFSGPIDTPFVQDAADSVHYRIKAWVETFGGDPKGNDTLVSSQTFGRRFARDDGSAEAGYGIEESAGSVALAFRAFVPDSLDAVELWLNATASSSASPAPFRLAIWADNNGKPGALLYESTSEISVVPESRFHTFALEKTVKVNGTFYVGWTQDHTDYLNVGFDRNRPRPGALFYRIGGGGWLPSALTGQGVAMIRPLAKRSLTIPEIPAENAQNEVFVSPNPARTSLHLTSPGPGVTLEQIQLLDPSGRVILTQRGDALLLELPLLPNGPYLLRIRTSNGKTAVKRLLIAHP